MHFEPLRNWTGNILEIGTRVRILCDEDKNFFNKIGIITLIDRRPNRRTYTGDRAGNVFVQMVRGGGGMWWHAGHVEIHTPRKRSKKVKLKT